MKVDPRAPRPSSRPGPSGQSARQVAACRQYLARRGALALALLALGGVGLALPLAWILAGSGGWSPGSALPLGILATAGLVAVVLVLWGRRRLSEAMAEPTLVARMEGAAGLSAGRLRAQLELGAASGGSSAALVTAGEAALQPALSRSASELSGQGRQDTGSLLRQGALLVGAMAVVAGGLLVMSPDRAETAWAGLASPLRTLNPPPLPPMSLAPGDARVPRGQGVLVQVEAEGRRTVVLQVDAPGVPTRTLELPVREGRAEGRIPAITGPTLYLARGDDGSVTPTYRLEPQDPLLFHDFAMEATYPAWTGLPPEQWSVPPSRLVVPRGTRLAVSGRVLDAQGKGSLDVVPVGDDGEEGDPVLQLGLEGDALEGEWRPAGSGRYRWVLRGEPGTPGAAVPAAQGLEPTLEMTVEVVEDQVPDVELRAAGDAAPRASGVGMDPDEAADGAAGSAPRAGTLPSSLRLPLEIHARDDWGLSWVALEVEVLAPDSESRTLSDRTELQGQRELVLGPTLDLSSWGLVPGGVVRIQARAADRAAGPGIGVSGVLEFRVPAPEALRQEAREQIRSSADAARALAEAAAEEAALATDRLRAQVADGVQGAAGADAASTSASTDPGSAGSGAAASPGDPPPSFQAREELREALAGELRLLDELEELRQALERGVDALGQGAEEQALRRLLAELEDQVARVSGDAASAEESRARRAEELEALEASASSAAEVAEAFQDAVQRQELLAERMAELRERLEEAALGSDVDAAREEAERLADDMERLSEARKTGAEDSAARDAASAAAERARALEAQVEALETRLRDRGEEGAAERAAGAAEALRESASRMDDAGNASTPPGASSGGEEEAEAAAAAREAAEALDEAAAEAADRRAREIRELLQGAALQAMALAHLADGMEGSAVDERPGRALAVRDGTRALAVSLGDGLLDAGSMARELSARAGAALREAEGLVDAGGQGGAGEAGPAHATRRALQALALAALEAMDRPGDQGEGEGGGDTQELMEAMESLAQDQAQLNQDAGAMADNPTPPSPGTQAASQMEQLAAAQDAIASSMAELGRRPGGERLAGNLEEMGRQAEELAAELASQASEGRPRAETVERQSELLERMLQAGRSLERDEPTEERRGTPAGWVDRPRVPALPPGLLEGSRRLQLEAGAMGGLSPAERRLILDYLARLQSGGGR